MDDRIELSFAGSDEVAADVKAFEDFLRNEVLAVSVERTNDTPADAHEVEIAGRRIEIGIARASR